MSGIEASRVCFTTGSFLSFLCTHFFSVTDVRLSNAWSDFQSRKQTSRETSTLTLFATHVDWWRDSMWRSSIYYAFLLSRIKSNKLSLVCTGIRSYSFGTLVEELGYKFMSNIIIVITCINRSDLKRRIYGLFWRGRSNKDNKEKNKVSDMRSGPDIKISREAAFWTDWMETLDKIGRYSPTCRVLQ